MCVCSLSSNLCFCRALFLSVWPHAFVPSPNISINHILICIRLYEHPSSSVRRVYVWVFVVPAHLSERSQDMASGLLGVLGTIF